MKYEVTYLLNGKSITTDKSDEHVRLSFEEDGVRKQLVLMALSKVVITNASISYDYK